MSNPLASTGSAPAARAATVRLSGPRGLALAVPQYLGFHPSESLVLLCLAAPRGRVGPVARVDLFEPDCSDVVEQLVGCAVRYADTVAVIGYYEGPRPPCLDVLLAALAKAEVPVTQVLSVRGGMIRRADSASAERGDPGVSLPGRDDAQARRLAAASALAGRRILPTRQALADSVAAPTGRGLVAARVAIAQARTALAERGGSGPSRGAGTRPARRTGQVDAALVQAVAEHADGGAVSLATAATLAVLVEDVGARDHLVARAVGRADPDVVAVLISVVGRCPDEVAPQICSVLAVAAYRFGDGALAQCAVDRVLAVRPDHRLAHLMLSVMAAGLPPSDLAGMADIATDTPADRASDDPSSDDAAGGPADAGQAGQPAQDGRS